MASLCPSPDVLFHNVPNLSDAVYVAGTRAFAHGGYSDIWRGIFWDGNVSRDVAIKIVRGGARTSVTTERLKKRISREIITWSGAEHRNIIPFYGLFWRPDDTELPAMVLPYCAAGTCTDYLKTHPEADRKDIMCQVADGLIYLHSLPKQVVHGDIKARHVLMYDDGTPLLAGFGLSRIVAESSTGLTTSSSRGTYRWMSPELFGDVEDQIQVFVTTASDVWAFGCLCLEILTDLIPWASIETNIGVMQAILFQRRQPSLFPFRESSIVGHIVRHCWAFYPEDRPSMSDLGAALRSEDSTYLHRPHCSLPPTPARPVPPHATRATSGLIPSLGSASSINVPSSEMSHEDCLRARIQYPVTSPGISSLMSAPEVISVLTTHGCEDITSHLDLSSCSNFPLSSGGFGDVYRGKLNNGVQIAIKTMRIHPVSSEEGKKPLKDAARELHTWSKCRHPSVLKLLGVVQFRDQIGMVAEWMEHGNLTSYIMRQPTVNRCQLCVSICDGLSYLHGTGIIHGDLKGLNVLITSGGTAVLTDFGNAVLQERTLQFTATTAKSIISARWAAPELIEGTSTCTTATDVYALGMTILETITANVPYAGKSDHAVYYAVAMKKEPPARPEDYITTGSPHGDRLWFLLTKCWAYSSKDRPNAKNVWKFMRTITQEGLTLTN